MGKKDVFHGDLIIDLKFGKVLLKNNRIEWPRKLNYL
jgi:hypothetical protein